MVGREPGRFALNLLKRASGRNTRRYAFHPGALLLGLIGYIIITVDTFCQFMRTMKRFGLLIGAFQLTHRRLSRFLYSSNIFRIHYRNDWYSAGGKKANPAGSRFSECCIGYWLSRVVFMQGRADAIHAGDLLAAAPRFLFGRPELLITPCGSQSVSVLVKSVR